MEKYDSIIEIRRDKAKWYDQNLVKKHNWILPPIIQGATYSHYSVRVPNRESLINIHGSRNIELGTVIQYCIPNMENYYNEQICFKNAVNASRQVVNYPLIK